MALGRAAENEHQLKTGGGQRENVHESHSPTPSYSNTSRVNSGHRKTWLSLREVDLKLESVVRLMMRMDKFSGIADVLLRGAQYG